MTSFRDVVAFLERRDRRLRGAGAGVWPILVASAFAFIWVNVSTFSRFELPAFGAWLFVAAGIAGALLAYGAAGRTTRPRPRLLFEVDVRLGLDARLSSLQVMEERRLPKPLTDRVFHDVLAAKPDWPHALPVPRSLVLLAATACALLALALIVSLVVPDPLHGAATQLAAPSVSGSSIVADEPRTANDEPSTAPPTAVAAPAPTATARSQRTLSEILSDLRPALASGAPEGETSRAELESELARLEARLDAEGARLSPDDVQTLRTATSSSPELAAAVEGALSSSNLDALRDTISQLLDPDSQERAPAASSTLTHATPAAEGTDSETPGTPTPGTGSPSPAAGAPGHGQEGAGSPPAVPQTPEPLFESGVGEVARVAAPLVVGTAGAASSYITSGVPIEAPASPDAASATWALSPAQIQSVLSGRELPAGATDTIRDYFQRITEATP